MCIVVGPYSSSTSSFSSAAGPSSSACVGGKTIKSLSAYRKWKGRQWKERVGKTTAIEKEEEVAVGIGLMEFHENESRLKPVRGKRVMLRISNKAPYSVVRTQAEAKFKAYHSNHYREMECLLLYESGKQAQFLPGTTEFFNLKRYKEEIGKDYKSIVLYLCTNEDLIASENPDLDTDGEENLTSEDERVGPLEKKLRFTQVESDEMDGRGGPSETETLRFNQVENDEMLDRQLQSELDNSEHAAPTDQSSPEVHANNEQDSPSTHVQYTQNESIRLR